MPWPQRLRFLTSVRSVSRVLLFITASESCTMFVLLLCSICCLCACVQWHHIRRTVVWRSRGKQTRMLRRRRCSSIISSTHQPAAAAALPAALLALTCSIAYLYSVVGDHLDCCRSASARVCVMGHSKSDGVARGLCVASLHITLGCHFWCRAACGQTHVFLFPLSPLHPTRPPPGPTEPDLNTQLQKSVCLGPATIRCPQHAWCHACRV